MRSRREVVVTGIGAVSPIGCGAEAFWQALLYDRPVAAPVDILPFGTSRYRTEIALVAPDAPRDKCDPALAFALRAAGEALSQASVTAAQRGAMGLAVATTAAGWTHGQAAFDAFRRGEDTHLHAEDLLKEGLTSGIAAAFGLDGPCALLSPACAAASSAIAWAAERIRDGDCDHMLTGASDALTEVVFAGFHSMRLLADDACRPFSDGRRGLVLSEGAAFLVLEEEAHARARSVPILARLSGWGLSCDAAHPTTPRNEGIAAAMRAALREADLSPENIGQVSAHGTGSIANDTAESHAIAAVLGGRVAEVPVTAIKGTVGHTEGAAGAFGAIAAVLSLRDGLVPPVRGFLQPDPALPLLRLVTGEPLAHSGRNVLVNASGFGGANACLVFEKPDARTPRFEPPPRRAVINTSVVLAGDAEPAARLWPKGPSLPLDSLSSRVLDAAERLLGGTKAEEPDAGAAVVLGACYGSQARHERMWAGLADAGPRGVDPGDFALSTFNAPGSAVAAAFGYGGANLVFLGADAGALALDEAVRSVESGRARRVLTGGYDEPTPYFQAILRQTGEPDARSAVCLLAVEDADLAATRGAAPCATVLGFASSAPNRRGQDATGFRQVISRALWKARVQAGKLAAAVLSTLTASGEAELAACEALLDPGVTLIDLRARFGNCLSAAAPLAVHTAIEAAGRGAWRSEDVLRGPVDLVAGRPVLVLSAGLLGGGSALVVMPHAR